MFRKVLLNLFFLLILSLIGIAAYAYIKYPQISTMKATVYTIESILNPHAKFQKHVIGFLPYWKVEDVRYIRPNLLSEINYFSLTPGADGHLATVENGQTDPGWREWQSDEVKQFMTKAAIMGTEVTVTVAALDNNLIDTILDNPTNQRHLIDDIVKEIKNRHLDGVTIDFEYFGEPDESTQTAFTAFSQKLNAAMEKETPNASLSIAIMPLAARENDLYDFPRLNKLYDRYIGMSYEYYGGSSDIAGPIAPMKGYKEGAYFFDVETTYEDYLKVIPKEKIVMGIPYYGWEWAVEDGKTKNSLTFPSDHENNYAAVISYARAREGKDLVRKQCQWDTLAQETWCWYNDKKSGVDRQIWLADNRSIQTRYTYAKQKDFGGVAIWTLGFDKNYSDLWDMLRNIFGK